jgi:murein DD-endopeptidase MepM/ murein hydrolase activator NlpD
LDCRGELSASTSLEEVVPIVPLRSYQHPQICATSNDRPDDRQIIDVSVVRPLILACLVALGIVLVPASTSAAPLLPLLGVWPLDGQPEVTRGFDPPVQRWHAGHRGVDLAARLGAEVRAAAGGTVQFAGSIAGRGVVVVDHGSVRSTYEPVVAEVGAGDTVVAGQMIGRIGRGSHCASTCLHWGLRRGEEYLDPLQLLGGRSGSVRLVGAAQRDAARAAAAARGVAEATSLASASTFTSSVGSAGDHGFVLPMYGAITSEFGMRFHPVLRVWKLHDGTDFGAACGTPIRAPYPGRVSSAYLDAGYGNRLMIDHGVVDGRRVITGFNHATRYVVSVGQQVSQGQVLGYVGSTGFSTGCHLHLMVWLDGAVVDPMTWL